MFLLDATANSQAFASWVSAAIALGALIVSGAALFQTKKIKELTDVVTTLTAIVDQLKTSNETTEKRFSMEKLANLRNSMPVFHVDYVTPKEEEHKMEIILKSTGTPFQYINTENPTKNVTHFYNKNTEGTSAGPPMIGVFFEPGDPMDDFEFDIRTKSVTGHDHIQRFVQKPAMRPDIRPPAYD